MGAKTLPFNYAWVIVIACLAFYAMPVGIIGNTAGIYATPVMEEFGWTRTEATLYMSIQQIVAALCTPFAGKILARFNPRWVLTIVATAVGASTAICVFFTEPWQWNIYGVMYGICAAFILFLAVPTIINRWFVKRSGFAIGIASAGIGVFGAIASPVTQMLIGAYGWQTARVTTSLVCLVVSAGLTALLLRPSPASMGVLPYGADESYGRPVKVNSPTSQAAASASPASADGAVSGAQAFADGTASDAQTSADSAAPASRLADGPASASQAPSSSAAASSQVPVAAAKESTAEPVGGATVVQALRSPGLYLLMLVAGCFSMGAFFMQQVPSICAVGPLGADVGAFAVSAIMLGTIVGKPLLGWLADRIGAVPTGIVAGAGGALGVAIAFVSGANAALFFAGVAIYGLGYSSLSIVSPMLGSQGFGTAHFSEIYSYVCMAISLCSAAGSFLFAFLFDVTGSFDVDFLLVIAIYLFSALLCPITVRLARRCWNKG